MNRQPYDKLIAEMKAKGLTLEETKELIYQQVLIDNKEA